MRRSTSCSPGRSRTSSSGSAACARVSAVFAVASLPVVALLLARLAGRLPALIGTVLVATSWTFLFHGVYGRMYSLFLLTAALSYLALLHAIDRGGKRAWALWALAILATVATHPYGALVLASQGAFVVAGHRERLREALWAFGAVAVLGIPFWLTDLVLAGRFDAGVAVEQPARRRPVRLAGGRRLQRRLPGPPRRPRGGGGRRRGALARGAAARGLRRRRPARRARGRAEHGLTRDAAPDLRPAVRGARSGRRDRQAGPGLGHRGARGARGRAGRLDVGPDAGALRVGARRAPAGTCGSGCVRRRHDPARRRAARVRPALPPGLGAEPGRPARRAPARRRRSGAAQPALARAPARPRRLGARLEQDDEHRPVAADPPRLPAPGVGFRRPRLRPVPRHPHRRAGA